ncbi:MAG: metalloregulator ArsR/SmtB family transcription factor [Candidatus Onthovivens sp.]|nr:metalloregulator ArsR/SmtB family transcription factor [Candidatus Onthovivens sp.]
MAETLNKKISSIKKEMINEREIYDISDFFKVFGDSTRIKILWALDTRSMTVSELCVALEMTKSAISHQLKTLKDNKLVKYKKIGKNVIYSLDDEHVSIIIETARKHLKEDH